MGRNRSIPAFSYLFLPFLIYSSLFQLIPTYSSLYQNIPVYSNLFQSFTAYSSLFQPMSSYSSLFWPRPAFLPIPNLQSSNPHLKFENAQLSILSPIGQYVCYFSNIPNLILSRYKHLIQTIQQPSPSHPN